MSSVKKELMFLLGHYGHIGITFVASIFIGMGAGILLDQKVFNGRTAPWFTFIGLAFGIAAGFKSLFDVLRRSSRNLETKTDEER
ncbi:AtpZ/AtpI family protein [Desulfofustis limnaeus]|jgi:F0F1-type ATP synthase assembly protein I|nr:AtpZ/AtpI family protein [Desulfofustis limnaeus]MDX9893816.1 AtpZ/AtpI family protein [Desulfofustis sp.]